MTDHSRMRRAAQLAWLCSAAAPALAQPPAAAADNQDEIIVTAQKREERLQDVPISISVQSGEALEAQSLNSYIALQSRIPNLSITDTPANASIFIRGIGTSGNTLSFEQSVALFVDQVYGGRNRQFMQPFFDVERIEVLRGPQGALFGRNTSAGAISVTTRRPTSSVEATVAGEYEAVRDSYSGQFTLSGPLNDTLGIRLAARFSENNGWLNNTTLNRDEPQREDALVRASLLWEPSDRVDLFLKAEFGRSKIIGSPAEFVPSGTRPDYRVDHDDGLAPLIDDSDSFNGTAQLNVGIGDHTLTSVSAYSSFDYGQAFNIQARRPARLVVVNQEEFRQFSQELRLASPAGERIDYIVGGYFEDSKSDIFRSSLLDLPPPPMLNQDNRRTFVQDTSVLAAFGQLNWRPVDQIKVGAGLRWTRIKKQGVTQGFLRMFAVNGTVTDIPRAPLIGEFSETDWSPSLSVAWEPSDAATFYAKYTEGAKGGAFVESATLLRDFILNPEQAESYELGGKFQFRPLNAFLNLALFSTDYTDLQKSTLDVSTATFVTSNAAGARVRGVELDAGFRPAPSVRVTFSGAYLDSKYTRYPNGPCAFPRHLIPNCVEDRTGDRLQNSPKWTGNVAVELDQPLSQGLRLLGNWTTSYQSDINYQDILHPLEVQEAFSKTDVRLGVADIDRDWELAVLVRNLFDKRTSGIIFQTFPIGIAPDDRVHLPDPKRSVTVQARVRF
jgi:iron complex outermembrane receptor protein